VVPAAEAWDDPAEVTADAHERVQLPAVVMVIAAATVLSAAEAVAVMVIAAGVPVVAMVIAVAVVMVGSAVRWVPVLMVLIVARVVRVVRAVRVALDSVPRSAAGKACEDYRF
jgi:hypothetical protein